MPFLWQVSYFTLRASKAHLEYADIQNVFRIKKKKIRIGKESSGHLIQSLPAR